jgi:hypothetical protein
MPRQCPQAMLRVSLRPGGLSMDELDPQIRDRISRRRMIKRLGAATAVAWTAPVLSTLGKVPALSAQQRCMGCAPLPPGNAHCAASQLCGSSGSNPCDCRTEPQGTCFCHSCLFCDTLPGGGQVCASSAECPAGWGCVLTDCGCDEANNIFEFLCHPGCTAPNNPGPCAGVGAAARSGRTSIR